MSMQDMYGHQRSVNDLYLYLIFFVCNVCLSLGTSRLKTAVFIGILCAFSKARFIDTGMEFNEFKLVITLKKYKGSAPFRKLLETVFTSWGL